MFLYASKRFSVQGDKLDENYVERQAGAKLFFMHYAHSCCVLLRACHEGCLLYFGNWEQKLILINENRFNVFQNMLHSYLYIFTKVWNKLSKHFWHPVWDIARTCILNASTDFRNALPTQFVFLRMGIKEVRKDAKSGLYFGWLIKSMFGVLKNFICSSPCGRARWWFSDLLPLRFYGSVSFWWFYCNMPNFF